MNTRSITIGIAVILLAGLAYYIGTNRDSSAADMATTTQQSAQTDAQATETSQSLVGEWKSDDDAKYTRTFHSDGTVTDTYQGEASATSTGTWKVFTSTMQLPTGVAFPLDSGVAYIQVMMDGEAYHYRVSSVTSSDLELIYMDRGGVLRFSKVN